MFQARSQATEEQTTAERRSAQRHTVVYRLDVIASEGSVGCLLDISSAGMRVRFKQALDVGEIESLRVEFPRWLELGDGLETRGRFVWVRSIGSSGTEAGFSFDGLKRKEHSVLEVLVQRLAEAVTEDQTGP